MLVVPAHLQVSLVRSAGGSGTGIRDPGDQQQSQRAYQRPLADFRQKVVGWFREPPTGVPPASHQRPAADCQSSWQSAILAVMGSWTLCCCREGPGEPAV